ncbi:MAG: hypothetical protein M1817_002487 [Caeruleum heppii]|nr:MAG: hypothetical protein M1817_002487 [Caeruleum heppii]
MRDRRASSTTAFDYRIAASFSAKGRRFNPDLHVFTYEPPASPEVPPPARQISGSRYRPRPASGQDSFFVSQVRHGREAHEGGSVAFGVADGVGGWIDSGIDSAHFAHGICQYMAQAASNFHSKPGSHNLRPRDLIETGYRGTLGDQSITGGGSTACVAVGNADGTLQVANLGDSGFVQLRLNAVHHYSNPQTHAFNMPYQLSIIPPRILARSAVYGGRPLQDLPRDASVTDHRTRHGDVLVFGTDGIWDNLSAQDLLRIVSQHMARRKAWTSGAGGIQAGKDLGAATLPTLENARAGPLLQTQLATAITGVAKQASINTRVDGPFAREMQRHYPRDNYRGGKVDDICVVVAVVVEEPVQQGQRQSKL